MTKPAGPGVITFNNDNSTWEPGYQAAAKVLKERTGFGLQVRAIPNVSNYQQVVRMSAQTDSTTDLIKWWNGYRLQDIVRGDILTDLTPAWEQAESEGWVTPSLRDSFSLEGKAYGVPLYKSYFAMFYSKKAFAKHGVEPPKTFDDLLDIARTFRDAGMVPISAGGASSWESLIWFQQLVAGLDPDFYQAVCSNRARFTDPTAQDAMALWASMYEDKLFSAPDVESTGNPGLLQSGDLGMTLGATWSANEYSSAKVGTDDVGMFLVPPANPDAELTAFVESGAISVPANAHKRDDAVTVTNAWLATDVQQAWVDFLGDISANPNAVPRDSVITPFAEEMVANPPRELTRYWEASPPVLVEGNVLDLSAFMVNPTTDNAKETLQAMQDRADQEWKVWDA